MARAQAYLKTHKWLSQSLCVTACTTLHPVQRGSIPMPIPLTSGVRGLHSPFCLVKSIFWEWPCPQILGGTPGTFPKENRSACMPGQAARSWLPALLSTGGSRHGPSAASLHPHSRALSQECHCVFVTRCVRGLSQTFREGPKLQIRPTILCGKIKQHPLLLTKEKIYRNFAWSLDKS